MPNVPYSNLRVYPIWGDVKGYPESILVEESQPYQNAVEKRLEEIAKGVGKTAEKETKALLSAIVVNYYMDEKDISFVMKHPSVMIITDGNSNQKNDFFICKSF